MNNKILLGTALLSAGALAWAAKDPVIMRVAGVDVPKSEFEYLYHKNSQQQIAPQPLEEYVEMFKNYKLKVADAKDMGLDTMASFKKEMDQYRSDLAAPYLVDSAYLNSLVDEAYQRSRVEPKTSHIMFFKTTDRLTNEANVARLDSIRNCLDAGEDFGELAKKFSQDRGSSQRGGSLGYISAGRYPYGFETAAYALKPGEYSKVVESPMAYHIVKVDDIRPAQGAVLMAHIMKMVPNGASPEQRETAKAQIDSIYNVVMADPSKFEALAKEYSDDPGSGQKGGMLPWFSTGQMVPEFEAESYRLAKDEISKPIRSQYGWHIIRKFDSKPAPELAAMKSQVLARVQHPQDERSGLIRAHQTERYAKKHNGKYAKSLADIRKRIETQGLDSLFYEEAVSGPFSKKALFVIGKTETPLFEVVPSLHHHITPDGIAALKEFDENVALLFNRKLVDTEINWLEANEPDYRNLLHEYRDGSLLYEASVRNVWDKAARDNDGLEAYFESHRGDYTWKEPRAKGILVQASNDSVANAVRARYIQLGADTVVNTLRKEFKNEVKVDRVLVSKGTNAMVDNLMFGGPQTQPSVAGFTCYFMLDPVLATAPQELSDVRAQVTSDYQLELERKWLDDLRAKYPVEVYEKVLRKVKPIQ